MASNILTDEFKYYLANQDKMVEQFNGKVIVIKNHTVLGAYGDEGEAVAETVKEHELGTFLVQRVSEGQEAYTQTFTSRVGFA